MGIGIPVAGIGTVRGTVEGAPVEGIPKVGVVLGVVVERATNGPYQDGSGSHASHGASRSSVKGVLRLWLRIRGKIRGVSIW